MTDDDDVEVRRDRREHGGAGRPDDEELARRTEQERVEAGLDAYDPGEVPAATDEPAGEQPYDPDLDEQFQEERGMFRRQESEGEVYPITEENPYPPTRYEEN